MKRKFIALMLSTLFLASCGAKQEAPKKDETQKIETAKKEEQNKVQDTIDPVKEGDLKAEKETFMKFKKETLNAFEYTYSLDAEHNKNEDKASLDGLKKYDKIIIDSTFQTIEKIIETCEKENRYFRESEMQIIKLQTEEITKLTEKWLKYIESHK